MLCSVTIAGFRITGNAERYKLIEKLRLKGNFLHNTEERYNVGASLIVARRPKVEQPASHYAVCHGCQGQFSIVTIRKHRQRCIGTTNALMSNPALSKRAGGHIHADASDRLVIIFSVMRLDDIVKLIRYDRLLIHFGNFLCEKYRKPQQEEMIRSRLRTLGRLLQVMKTRDPAVTDFESIYSPMLYDLMLASVNELAEFDSVTGEYKTPSLVTTLGTFIPQVGDRLIMDLIKRMEPEKEKNVERYLFLHKNEYSAKVNRVALETQAKKKREKAQPLPTTNDIKLLSEFVVQNMSEALEALRVKYSYANWRRLVQFTLISVQIFNRRRAGEIERVLISDLEQLEKINKTTNPELYESLAPEDREMVHRYSRFVITGKLSRVVPVLVDSVMEESLEMIIKYRASAKVPKKNPHLFGLPGYDIGRFKYERSCQLMREFSTQCGAEFPERLRGTLLRKHMATSCATQNIDENEIVDIANFMGHAEAIHRSHYRQTVVTRDVVGVAKMLLAALGVSAESGTSTDKGDKGKESRQNGTTKNKGKSTKSSTDNIGMARSGQLAQQSEPSTSTETPRSWKRIRIQCPDSDDSSEESSANRPPYKKSRKDGHGKNKVNPRQDSPKGQ